MGQKPSKKKPNHNTSNLPLIVFLTLVVAASLSIIVAISHHNGVPKLENYSISHDLKFGGVYIETSIDDFNKLGFKYGDSVDVTFSNGFELRDLPYYNGFYVDIDEPLLLAYPGYEYIKVGINYGDDLWLAANLTEDDTASVKLSSASKYLKIQNSRDIHYSDTQGDTPDAVFANFRNVTTGSIKGNTLYRSASPIDNSHNRAPVVDKLIAAAGINYVLDLSDDSASIAAHIAKEDFNSPYFELLYNNGKVLPLALTAQFENQAFKENLVKGLTGMSTHAGPYLVHCVEGKDRTGYVLIVIEALLGASYDEMVNDYMKTYDNYYGITPESNPDNYNTIKEQNIDLMLHYVIGDEAGNEDLTRITDYSTRISAYLLSIGMSQAAIDQLIHNLTS